MQIPLTYLVMTTKARWNFTHPLTKRTLPSSTRGWDSTGVTLRCWHGALGPWEWQPCGMTNAGTQLQQPRLRTLPADYRGKMQNAQKLKFQPRSWEDKLREWFFRFIIRLVKNTSWFLIAFIARDGRDVSLVAIQKFTGGKNDSLAHVDSVTTWFLYYRRG